MASRTVILFDSLEDLPPPTSRVPASHIAYLVAQTLPPPRLEIVELSSDDLEDEDGGVDSAW